MLENIYIKNRDEAERIQITNHSDGYDREASTRRPYPIKLTPT
jgi:hypothetical protein